MMKQLLVIELANVLAGPSVGQWLAELGARVIKIENARGGGDVTRSWQLPEESAHDGRSAYFCSINWGKESLALDLRQPEAQQAVQRLAARADLVLASYLPGQAAKLGVDAATLRRHNPGLIYASISGYGPDSTRPAFDAIIQAEAGFTYLNGSADTQYKMPVALMDVLAAHHLKEAILLALLQRQTDGQGQDLHVSLLDAGLASLANQASNYLVGGIVPQPSGSEHPNIVPYGTMYRCADERQLVLAVGNDGQFARLCAVLGQAVPADYATNPARVRAREAVNAWLQGLILTWQRDALLQALEAASVPAGAVRDMAEVCASPAARRLQVQAEGLRGFPQRIDTPHPPALTAPPRLNQDGAAILRELGYTDKQVNQILGHGSQQP